MWNNFFTFLVTHTTGILILLLCLVVGVLLIQWLAFVFGLGRYGKAKSRQERVGFVLTELIAKIVNDFRHLLALVIVLIFALALAYTLIRAGGDLGNMTKALQAVVATLGGLIGSIIGYYFGESAARKASAEEEVVPEVGPEQTEQTLADKVAIEPAPKRPAEEREHGGKPEGT